MDPLTEKLLAFAMVLTRISAFVLIVPVFSSQSVPVRIKAAAALLLTIFFYMIKLPQVLIASSSAIQIAIVLVFEATYGLALGLIAALIFAVVGLGGRIAERQMGLAMAQIMDPMTGERARPLSMLLEMLFIIMFLAANGHHLLILIISRSFDVFAAGSVPTIAALTGGVIEAGAVMLIAALQMAAPLLAAFLLLLVALAVLARIAPEMNILFISLPMRVGLGLIMTIILVPFINGFVSQFAQWMNKLLPL